MNQPEKNNRKKTYDRGETSRKVIAMLKEQKAWLGIWLFVLAVGTGIELATAKLVEYFINVVLAQTDTTELWNGAIKISALVVLLFLFQGIQKGAEVITTTRIGQRMILEFRKRIFDHLQELSLDFFESRRTGHIMSFVTNDVIRIRDFAGKQMAMLVKNPVSIVAFLAIMIYTSWQLTLVGLAIMPFVVLIVQAGSKKIRIAAANLQESLAKVSGELQENLSAIQVVRAFANEEYEKEKFGRANLESYKTEMKRARIEATIVPIMTFIGSIGLAGLMLYGVYLVLGGALTKGSFGMIIYLLYRTNDSAVHLGRAFMSYQDTLAAIDRVYTFLKIQPSIVESTDAISIQNCYGKVEFRDVSFHYDDGELVLKNISLLAEPGMAIAIVGPSGAGKSSLGKLLPRFYDVSDGEILIDGIDIRKFSLNSLRNQMAIVPQDTVLLHGTVRENIAYGKLDATDEEIIDAAKKSNAHEFISALDNGYDTVVGERGVKLSGGQRQRISIARAILKDPKILILDEATSNLDTESEKIVQQALEKLMVGRTTFIIAHRLSTVRNADEIIVMKSGRIVDNGTHEELLSREGVYRELYLVEEMSEKEK